MPEQLIEFYMHRLIHPDEPRTRAFEIFAHSFLCRFNAELAAAGDFTGPRMILQACIERLSARICPQRNPLHHKQSALVPSTWKLQFACIIVASRSITTE
jgi:hypothetical protein